MNEINTYAKFMPNVFLAKCPSKHEKGEIILVKTKHGQDHECIIFNLIFEKNENYYYSIVRADGFNSQQRAKNKAEKLLTAAQNSEKKSNSYFNKSKESASFLSLGEPIKIGHHSESRHRRLIERNNNRMSKSIETMEKAKEYSSRAEYWKGKENMINLSMPESIDFFTEKLKKAKEKHEGIKKGFIEKTHSYSLQYAKKEVNEIEKKLKIAIRLWGGEK